MNITTIFEAPGLAEYIQEQASGLSPKNKFFLLYNILFFAVNLLAIIGLALISFYYLVAKPTYQYRVLSRNATRV